MKMEDNRNNPQEENEMSMNDALDSYSVKRLNEGDILKGKVIKVTKDEIFVNINHFSDGVVSRDELTDDHDADLTSLFSNGDDIDVIVLKADDGEGNVKLSKIKADAMLSRDSLKEAFDNGTPLKVRVKEVVKGGLRMSYMGIEGFMPASMASDRFVEDLRSFEGKVLDVKVAEYEEDGRRLIFSRKAFLAENNRKLKEKLLLTLKEGDTVEGTVESVVPYGAFIDLGGVTGLCHVSDLSYKRVSDPLEVVAVGDKVTVHILKIDRKKDRISLSLKNKAEDPWRTSLAVKRGDIVPGKVSKLIDSGAFVSIGGGLEGFVHVSEISSSHVASPKEALKEGQEVMVMVLDVNADKQRISLSIKDAEGKGEAGYFEDDNLTLGDMFKGLLDKFKEE